MKPIVRLLFALVLLGALVACSASKFAYNRLDWIAGWELRKFVSLTTAQQEQYDKDFETFWQWHRKEQLPLYAQDLRAFSKVANGTTTEELKRWVGKVTEYWNLTVEKLAPAWCTNLVRLDDAQVQSVKKSLDERITEARKDFVDAPEKTIRREAEKRFIKRLKPWFGKVNQQQRAMIKAWSQQRPLDYSTWLAQRERWRDQFILQLNQRHNPGFCQNVKTLFIRKPSESEFGFPLRNDASRDAWIAFTSQLINTMDESQRTHFVYKLEELADDFELLSQQAS
ncbi:MAG: DUF6279 family lipoprotein [Salinisphaeraceae bacterium]|nr:DUF6279 family lipoprotein [Salinisphaeraceae bacterium]